MKIEIGVEFEVVFAELSSIESQKSQILMAKVFQNRKA